ncbi:MAG: hypothetical protein HYX68_28915 [Planctomycetes bacterium]|nr:hypothetical protein [Planctomycetota bacterium]
MIEFRGKTLLAARRPRRAKITLSELNDLYQPVWTRELALLHPAKVKLSLEDPRLFIFCGQLHVALTGCHFAFAPQRTSMVIARLDGNFTAQSLWIPEYGGSQIHEKNWQFFESDGDLFSVYSVNPHVILRHEDAQAHVAGWTACPIAMKPGTMLRGGAPPVRVGNEFYHWFHTVETAGGLIRYGFGLYTFDPMPPFTIRRWSNRILFSTGDQLSGWNKLVVFPCGALLRRGHWIISYGWQDRECRVALFDAGDVERQLQ